MKTVKLTKSRICEMYTGLEGLKKLTLPVLVVFALARTKRSLEPVYASIQETIGHTQAEMVTLHERDAKLVEIARAHRLRFVDDRVVFPDPEPDDIVAFREKYDVLVDEIRTAQKIRERDFFANDELIPVGIYTFPLALLDDTALTLESFECIVELIEE